ncbi:MAG: DUF3791 domain-containing protein [Longibaculum sp.]
MKIKNQDELEFVIFCIENVALKLNKNPKEVFNLFLNTQLIDYLTENYEILHSLSKEYIVNDLVDILKKEGVHI